jgi:hypothetical protein
MSNLRIFAPAMRWQIVAALAGVTFAASPGLTAGHHAPHHTSQPGTQSAGQAGGAATPIGGQTKREGGDATTPGDTTVSKTTPKEPADHGGKATDNKSVAPIDLTRPDDGYGNLRRRAERHSLIAAQKKPVLPPATIALHPPGGALAEHPRNATGAAVPAVPTLPAAVGAAKPEPFHAGPTAATAFGGAKNNLGLSLTVVHPTPVHVATTPAPSKPPVMGINGTSLHQGASGIGGPANDHSAITGSSYRHK